MQTAFRLFLPPEMLKYAHSDLSVGDMFEGVAQRMKGGHAMQQKEIVAAYIHSK